MCEKYDNFIFKEIIEIAKSVKVEEERLEGSTFKSPPFGAR